MKGTQMQELVIASKNPDFIQAEAGPGAHIIQVCSEAVSMALAQRVPVRFNFNGIDLEATESDQAEGLVKRYHQECDNRSQAWKQSDEGRRAAAAHAEKLSLHQAAIDGLLRELPIALQSEVSTVAWIGKFTEHADFVGTSYDKDALAAQLEAAGYAKNDCVGHAEIGSNGTIFAKWLVGQVLDCLLRGDGPHPVAMKFAADYAAKFAKSLH